MKEEILSPRAWQVIELAKKKAREVGCQSFTPEHILWVILDIEEGRAKLILQESGINLENLKKELLSNFKTNKQSCCKGEILKDRSTRQLLDQAFVLAKNKNYTYVGTQHILLAMLKGRKIPGKAMRKFGLNYKRGLILAQLH